MFSAEIGSANPEKRTYIILGLVTYFFPVNALSNQKRAMRRGVRKPHILKVRRHADRMIDLNKYWDMFPGAKISDKFFMTELN